MLIGLDVHVHEPELAIYNPAIGVADVGESLPNALDL
jgi:hypothetical protein